MVFKKVRAKAMFFALRRLPEDKRAMMSGLAMSGISKEAIKVNDGAKKLAEQIKEENYSNESTRIALKLEKFVKENKQFIKEKERDSWNQKTKELAARVLAKQATKADSAFLKKEYKNLVKGIETAAMRHIMDKFGVKEDSAV